MKENLKSFEFPKIRNQGGTEGYHRRPIVLPQETRGFRDMVGPWKD